MRPRLLHHHPSPPLSPGCPVPRPPLPPPLPHHGIISSAAQLPAIRAEGQASHQPAVPVQHHPQPPAAHVVQPDVAGGAGEQVA